MSRAAWAIGEHRMVLAVTGIWLLVSAALWGVRCMEWSCCDSDVGCLVGLINTVSVTDLQGMETRCTNRLLHRGFSCFAFILNVCVFCVLVHTYICVHMNVEARS